MLDLEGEVIRLSKENETLLKQNLILEERLKRIEKENVQLRKKVGLESNSEHNDGIILDNDDNNSCSSVSSGTSSVQDTLFNLMDENGLIFDINMGESSSESPCSSLAGTFESAELISGPQQKEQVPCKSGLEALFAAASTSLKTLKTTQTSIQHQLTSFLILFLATILMSQNSLSSSKKSETKNNSLPSLNQISSVLKELNHIPTKCSSQEINCSETQSQLNSVLQLFQNRIRLRMWLVILK